MDSIIFTDQTDTTKTKKIEHIAPSGIKEILCDGYFYDVTSFISRHPGGSVIKYYTQSGEDATHAIQQFHQRSPGRVKMMMNAFKKRPASDSERGYCLTNFYLEFSESLCDFSWIGPDCAEKEPGTNGRFYETVLGIGEGRHVRAVIYT